MYIFWQSLDPKTYCFKKKQHPFFLSCERKRRRERAFSVSTFIHIDHKIEMTHRLDRQKKGYPLPWRVHAVSADEFYGESREESYQMS